MKLIKKKYRELQPTIECLTDEVVLAQAWKKTHRYIRAHNWYADTLALDISALGLESNVKRWKEVLLTPDKLSTEPLQLVPAPKSDKWHIDEKNGWLPFLSLENRQEKLPIRPLAHMMIREQTWATALMLCLADIVETFQRDCSEPDFLKAQANKVYSYGNRLLCEWRSAKTAWFRWGNSETYRKFFTDYQAFLKRPVHIGREVADKQDDLSNVFIVSLDIAKFYDHIDRKKLLSELKALVKDSKKQADDAFWCLAEKIIDWQWDSAAQERAKELGLKLGNGLPQGLAAAGFFANAYLARFDQEIGSFIGGAVPSNSKIEVHDYCRYVDDLRIVVSADSSLEPNQIGDSVAKWVGKELAKVGEDLKINDTKIKVTALSDLNNRGTLSARVEQIQSEISGPVDRETVDGVMGLLEGLLTFATDDVPQKYTGFEDLALIRLATFDHDIRPDTLKRFAANRLESAIRNKRKMVDSDVGYGDENIDNESELLAKKLIWAWMQDPSLALVLRKALEIFPSPELLEPIIDAIYKRCSLLASTSGDCISSALMDYLLADLFRCCVDFHSYFQRVEYPLTADPDAMLSVAVRYAQKIIAYENVPVFMRQQALMLLAVLQHPVAIIGSDDKSIHHGLHAILGNQPIAIKRQNLALYEVASQITGKPDMIALTLLDNMNGADTAAWSEVLDELAKRGGTFWHSVWKRIKQNKKLDAKILSQFSWAAPAVHRAPKPSKQYLSKIIAADNNGFVHESALIKLALALIELNENKHIYELSPSQISVEQSQQGGALPWGGIWNPNVKLKCTIDKKNDKKIDVDPRFKHPDWLIDQSEGKELYHCSRIMYSIGCVLRSAVTGSSDFTASNWKGNKVRGYKGLRTNWYKRRMGMMHSPESMVGEFATVSGWFSELLMTSLQWPGFEASYLHHTELTEIDSIEAYQNVLKDRLSRLNELYCYTSGMPALLTEVKRPKSSKYDNLFRVVTVQQLLPKISDFSPSDPLMNSPAIRKQQREHLARVCQITYKTLLATLRANKSTEQSSADLIVFAELAVHPDDEDIIKRLADKTRSMILAGLTYQDKNGEIINVARWYIPDYRDSGRNWIIRDQGKAFPIPLEVEFGVKGCRPCQHIIEVVGHDEGPFRLSGAICYDATDLKLAADLKSKTDLFIVLAHNKDVTTFDNMVSALHYHMYQHVVLVNKGEFGGSTIQAPYKDSFERLISHSHGKNQISINVADLDLAAFSRSHTKPYKEIKTRPAGK